MEEREVEQGKGLCHMLRAHSQKMMDPTIESFSACLQGPAASEYE
jgi:hypothetical protein